MERTIGIDVHAASCTLAVISEAGRRLRSMVVETNGEALVGAILSVAGHRRVVLEEGTQAGWLSELLEPHAAEVAVAVVDGRRGQKSDELDAYELADRLRLGAVKRRVFEAEGQFRELRHLARAYRMLTADTVRIKNRLKSLFRARGIPVGGQALYNPSNRADTRSPGRDWPPTARRARRPSTDSSANTVRGRASTSYLALGHRH